MSERHVGRRSEVTAPNNIFPSVCPKIAHALPRDLNRRPANAPTKPKKKEVAPQRVSAHESSVCSFFLHLHCLSTGLRISTINAIDGSQIFHISRCLSHTFVKLDLNFAFKRC